MKIINVKKSDKWFPLGLLILFVLLVAFRITGSSVGIFWYIFNGGSTRDESLIFGQPRGIRTDEFLVSTQWMAAQSQVGFPEENPLLGSGQNMVLTTVPVANWTAIFKPQNWAFFILPLEYAFAYWWWFRALILVLSAYLFFLDVSRRNLLFSALGASLILFTPVIQWWYATSFVEAAAYFFLLLFIFKRIIKFQSVKCLIIWAAAFSYTSLCFAFLLYVPVLVATSLCLAFLMVGILLDEMAKNINIFKLPSSSGLSAFMRIATSGKYKTLLLAFSIIAMINVTVLFFFFLDNQTTIAKISNSVYPGNRRAIGGTLTPSLFLGGFYDIQLLSSDDLTPLANNQSEASSFFPFSFFLLPVMIFSVIKSILTKSKMDFFLIFSLTVYLLLLFWCFFGLPSVIARLFFLDLVPVNRTLLTFAVLNYILIAYYIFEIKIEQNLEFEIFSGIYSIVIFILYLYWTTIIKDAFPNFIRNFTGTIVIIACISVMMFLLLRQKHLIFLSVFFIFSFISTFIVNPLYQGLNIIMNSSLSNKVHELNQKDYEDSLWVVYDSLPLANYLAGNGAHVLNSTQFVPQNELWKVFDTKGKYIDIYDRYAHIAFMMPQDQLVNQDIKFSLVQEDMFAVTIDPCNPRLSDLNVVYYLFAREVTAECLTLVEKIDFPNWNVYLYTSKKY